MFAPPLQLENCSNACFGAGRPTSSQSKPRLQLSSAAPALLQAVRDFDAMNGELRRLTELGKLFECADCIGPTADAIAAMTRELVMVKDTWDAAAAAQHEVQVRRTVQGI